MAYYIDDAKKTAVKYEGKSAFAWNAAGRKFDIPTSDVSPKRRMTRCSDFEARQYLFEIDPTGYEELGEAILRNLDDMPERTPKERSTVPEAEVFLQECKADCGKIEPLVEKYRVGIQDYAMEASEYGRLLSLAARDIESVMTIAELNLEIAQRCEEIARREREINAETNNIRGEIT